MSNPSGHLRGCQPLWVIGKVGITLSGASLPVAKEGADDRQGQAVVDGGRCKGVPEVMEAEALQPSSLLYCRPGVLDVNERDFGVAAVATSNDIASTAGGALSDLLSG